jgi:NTE family protein
MFAAAMRKLLKIFVSGFVFVLAQPLQVGAQDNHRPRIGLVLDGGGALGLAHIGALQWMEENHIPIDMIAGTSMGGLVGGAYAAGETPEQIRALVQGIDWNEILSDGTPYRELSFRRKEDRSQYPMDVLFGVGKRIYLQEGYKAGQQVQLLLDKIALPYSEVRQFDDLPTPFACVATDLVSGSKHVFRSGSLAQAMRATMSLPGIFAPVRTGNAVYADGGLLDNLPVDVAKQMGADITIAVYLQTASLKPAEKLSTVAVLGRSLSVMIAANELNSIEQADVLVTVPLQDYTALDYDKADVLIQKGYQAAASKANLLRRFSLDDASWKEYLAERKRRMRTVPVPQFVKVEGVTRQDAQQIEKELQPDLHQPIRPDKIASQLTAIASDQRVSNLSYGLTTNLSGAPGIEVSGVADPFGKNILRPLVLIDGWDYKNVILSVGARLTVLDLGKYGAELRNDVLLGSEYLASSEYLFPLNSSHTLFLAPRLFGDNAPLNLYSRKGLIAEYRNRTLGSQMDAGYFFGRSAQLRLGYETAEQKLYPNVGDPQLYPRAQGREGDTHARFTYDGLDSPLTPMRGLRLQARAEWWDAKPGAQKPFPLVEMTSLGFVPFTQRSSIYLGASGGSTLTQNPSGLQPFSLGGSFRIPAYNTNELLTNQYFLFQGGYVRQTGALSPLVGGKVLFFAGADVGKAYYLKDTSHLPSDGSAGFIINTLFGPVVFGGAIGDVGHYKFFIQLGKTYF